MTNLETMIRSALEQIDASDALARENVYLAAHRALEKLSPQKREEQLEAFARAIENIEAEYVSEVQRSPSRAENVDAPANDSNKLVGLTSNETVGRAAFQRKLWNGLMFVLPALILFSVLIYANSGLREFMMSRPKNAEINNEKIEPAVTNSAGQSLETLGSDLVQGSKKILEVDFFGDLKNVLFRQNQKNVPYEIVSTWKKPVRITSDTNVISIEKIKIDPDKIYLAQLRIQLEGEFEDLDELPVIQAGAYNFDADNKQLLKEAWLTPFIHRGELRREEKTENDIITLSGLLTNDGTQGFDKFEVNAEKFAIFVGVFMGKSKTSVTLDSVKVYELN